MNLTFINANINGRKIVKFSKFYAPTTKEAPKDAILPSHQFLVRAGFIAQNGAGLYDFLPLGKMVLNRIIAVVKDEMNKSGALEVAFSVVTPSELWKESGRFEKYGKELLRFKDRKENEFVLSPTNEESAVNLVKNRVSSYKQLPLHIYQINTKFRDEARPRFGLLRGREFIMKDGYSFHTSQEDLKREFENMFETYSRIFTRLGLNFRCVDADSGAIGGNGSKEFMVLAKNGEDDILICKNCKYCANIEAAVRSPKTCEISPPISDKMDKFYTPNIRTCAELAEFFKTDEFYTIKAVIKKAIYENGKSNVVVFFVRGCDELQETKAQNAANALEIMDPTQDEIKNAGIIAGFCGIIKMPPNVPFFIDNELKNSKNMICGANELDYHYVGVSVVNFDNERFFDLIALNSGDKCKICGGKLEKTKGIEVGHIFQLGTKYSSAMNATFLDENGKAKPYFMGCYGIGVTRLLAVITEQNHDEKGCIWSKENAPFELEIIISNVKDDAQVKFANEIYEKCQNLGILVLLDDRAERFGVKMNDFELIGFPYAILVGKSLNDGNAEFIERKTLKKSLVSKEQILDKIKEVLC